MSTGRDDSGVDRPGDDAFFEQMRSEKNQRQEWSAAFAREQSKLPGIEELLDHQQRQANRITHLQQSVVRLQRNLLLSNLIVGTAAIAMLSAAGYAYVHSADVLRLVGNGNGDVATARLGDATLSGAPTSEFVLESDSEFKIRSDVDRKYQLIVRELYNRARAFRRPSGGIEARTTSTEAYVRFMADLSRVIEEAARDQPSSEIMIAITNIAVIGQESRRVERMEDLDIETRDKIDQVATVLRAHDARSRSSEPSSTPYLQ